MFAVEHFISGSIRKLLKNRIISDSFFGQQQKSPGDILRGRLQKENASEFLLKRFLFKSATTYFHAPFPANYLRHK